MQLNPEAVEPPSVIIVAKQDPLRERAGCMSREVVEVAPVVNRVTTLAFLDENSSE